MKKNRMMRLASGLLVAVLITTSMISGTYAKYVTTDSVADKARVAKFGVVVTAEGSLFAETYKDAPTTEKDAQTVVTSVATAGETVGEKVVAPGTNNADDTFKFSITGKPEVDVKIEVVVSDADTEKPTATSKALDIFLAQKTGLPDMTTGDKEDTFNNDTKYNPIKYTLKKGTTVLVDGGTLEALEIALEAISAEKVDANTDLATTYGEYAITWEWDFDANGAGTYDKQDTLLGDLAAGTTLEPTIVLVKGTDYQLDTSIKIAITVTQID